MGVTTTQTNKPLNPRGNDQSPLAYNRAKLYSGKALDFDGVNDYVDLDGFTLSGTTATISFYYNTNTTKALAYVFDNSQRWVIGQADVVNKFGFYDGSTWRYSTQTLTLGEWYHITVVIDGGNVEFLWNGQSVGDTFTGANSISWASITNFRLGWSHVGSGFGQLDGQIAGFKIFNTALTAAQVADLYNNPEKVVPTGVDNTALKLWLPMMEGAGTTAYDGSGNGNHGTISGATYVNGIGAPVAQSAVMDWNKSSNYIYKSEEFETTSWSENALLTITNDSFIAPDGSATATEIVENTLNTNHYLAQTLSVTAGGYFISVYAKKRDYDWIQLSTGGDILRYANFNISTGATGNASGITDLIIQDVGNDWYRIGGSITTGATSFNYFVTLIQSDVASRFQTYTGTDKGQYIWGAQVTKSATLQPYLRNIGTSEITSEVLLPQGLTTGRDITGVNLFENVRKQGALNLDGNSWAEVHDNESLDFGTGSFSLEVWSKAKYISSGSIYNVLLTLGDNVSSGSTSSLYIDSSLNYTFRYDSTLIVAGGSSEGDWSHVVGVYDGTNINIYLNGSFVVQTAASATSKTNTYSKRIGTDTAGASRTYKDQIAQPRIYNRALTNEEIQRNYNAGKNTYTN